MKVVVIGAGLAGTLSTVALLRGGAAVTLVERSGDFGPGVAYGTPDVTHLLNVPAGRMSAFPEDPGHFVDWVARRHGSADPAAYLPRRLYGAYLRDVLAEAAARPDAELERVQGTVTDVRRGIGGTVVALEDGRRVRGDAVVVAVGSVPCAPPLALPDDPRAITDPWSADALAAGAPGTHAVVVGSGLTAIDVALSISAGGGAVTLVSRRGRVPHGHLEGLRVPSPLPDVPRGPTTLADLEHVVGTHVAETVAGGGDWRDAVDGLRPHVAELWRLLPAPERRRFLADRVRDWDVCRHRMAPEVARRVAALRRTGRLRVLAGGVRRVDAEQPGLRVTLADGDVLRAARVVVCTGAGTDVHDEPLLRRLIERGLATPDDVGLGVRTDADGALLDAAGRALPWLLTLGPARRGELWETTAAPEIRVQAQRVAAALLGHDRAAVA